MPLNEHIWYSLQQGVTSHAVAFYFRVSSSPALTGLLPTQILRPLRLTWLVSQALFPVPQ